MSAQAHPTKALRPYLATDAPLLAEIFRASVEELTGNDYSPAQQDAWIATADDEKAFAQHLAERLTVVGTVAGSAVGFAALEDNRRIDMLYVHPSVTGMGIATMLVDALEKLAAARGTKQLSVDASDGARPFFEKRGYVPQQRNTVSLGGEWIGNTTMTKRIGGTGSTSR